MDEISKKDLLSETGISYGQLYRWKREGLIPEAWFSKRSAFTGQETFFPRTRMLDRIRAILAMKDDFSLDDIRSILRVEETQVETQIAFAAAGLKEPFLAALEALKTHSHLRPEAFAAVYALYEAAQESGVTEKELTALTNEAIEIAARFENGPAALIFFSVLGKSAFAFSETAGNILTSAGEAAPKILLLEDVLERLHAEHPAAFMKAPEARQGDGEKARQTGVKGTRQPA